MSSFLPSCEKRQDAAFGCWIVQSVRPEATSNARTNPVSSTTATSLPSGEKEGEQVLSGSFGSLNFICSLLVTRFHNVKVLGLWPSLLTSLVAVSTPRPSGVNSSWECSSPTSLP